MNMAENTRKSEDRKMTLRLMELSDIEDFMVWASDERVSHFCIWETHTSHDEALQFLNNNAIPHPLYRMIRTICTDDRAIGSILMTPNFDNRSCTAELGYVLGFDQWGKGIATEAVKMVASTIFRVWPLLERLEAFVDVDNIGSQRVLAKSGFVREGALRKHDVVKEKSRDVVVFSLLPSEQNVIHS